MPLEKNPDRRNILAAAREERLARDDEGVFWLIDDDGELSVSTESGLALAAGELIVDGDLVQLDDLDEAGRHPVVVTEAGVALWDSWASA